MVYSNISVFILDYFLISFIPLLVADMAATYFTEGELIVDNRIALVYY